MGEAVQERTCKACNNVSHLYDVEHASNQGDSSYTSPSTRENTSLQPAYI